MEFFKQCVFNILEVAYKRQTHKRHINEKHIKESCYVHMYINVLETICRGIPYNNKYISINFLKTITKVVRFYLKNLFNIEFFYKGTHLLRKHRNLKVLKIHL